MEGNKIGNLHTPAPLLIEGMSEKAEDLTLALSSEERGKQTRIVTPFRPS